MRRGFILLTIILLCHSTLALAKGNELPVLGKEAYASIVTCGPGDDSYTLYGHSALRIRDTSQRIDIVFNYGSFDYTEKFFYLKFFRGQLDYFLWPYYYDEFIYEYVFEGRAVWEQELNLDSVELNRLFAALMENTKPENMFYKYDFFRDNCATRVRDMIDFIIGEENHTGYGHAEGDCSYRDLLYKYSDKSKQWWLFGLDALLGMRCDRKMEIEQYMYVPMEMMAQYDTIRRTDGTPMVNTTRQLLRDCRTPKHRNVSPTLFFWILFATTGAVTFVGIRRGWKLYWFDAILFGTCATVSLAVCYLWFFSGHWCAKENLNVIWANPLFIWILARLRKPTRLPAIILTAVLLIFLAGWAWWPQHFNSAVIPIALTLAVRLLPRIVQPKHENTKTQDNEKI